MSKKDTRTKNRVIDEPVPDDVLDAVDRIIDGELAKEKVRPEEFFDAAVAKEMAKIEPPKPPRKTAPLNIGLAISRAAETLPEGVLVGYPQNQEFSFLAEGEDAKEIDYPFTVKITAETNGLVMAGIEAMIRAANQSIIHDGVEVYLHACEGWRSINRIPGEQKYFSNLKYLFRIRPIVGDPEPRR